MDKEKQRHLTELTKAILLKNNVTYEEWLYQTQLDYVTKNSKILVEALNKGE